MVTLVVINSEMRSIRKLVTTCVLWYNNGYACVYTDFNITVVTVTCS